jgi:hypothetical protein
MSECEGQPSSTAKIDSGSSTRVYGIVTWYFDHVMEWSPLKLQFTLLLLGCALSFYLRGIDGTVTSVVLGITSFGIVLSSLQGQLP